MTESRGAEGTDAGTHTSDVVVDEQAGVQLVYRPQPADTLAGLRVRERVKRSGLLVRGVFLALWVAYWLLAAVGRGSIDVASTVPLLVVLLLVWGYPRLQAAQVQRTVAWQGEYRAMVSPTGITCHNDHSTLIQKWSVFQGYRETAEHFVLLSRDPNIMCLDVLPKRGVLEAGGLDRLRAVLDAHTKRL